MMGVEMEAKMEAGALTRRRECEHSRRWKRNAPQMTRMHTLKLQKRKYCHVCFAVTERLPDRV